MWRTVVLGGILVFGIVSAGHAAGDADAAKGLLAEHCVACHRIPGYTRPEGVAELGAPPFLVIARAPNKYPEPRLRASLRRPHWPMTRFILSDKNIDNILAYIKSLRRE